MEEKDAGEHTRLQGLTTPQLSFNDLNHLGFSLYSNVPTALSEVIANSWDADGDNVTITLDKEVKKVA